MLEKVEKTELVEEEVEEGAPEPTKDTSKIVFPISGIVIISVLVVCIAICLIVIFALNGK